MIAVFFVCVEVRAGRLGLKYAWSARSEDAFYVIVYVVGYDIFEVFEDLWWGSRGVVIPQQLLKNFEAEKYVFEINYFLNLIT